MPVVLRKKGYRFMFFASGGMTSSASELDLDMRATGVVVSDDTITVDLDDGRSIVVPTSWYPRLKHATRAERLKYEIDGYGISWPQIEADFSIRGLLLGRKSGESPESFKFWLENRRKGRKTTFEEYVKLRRAKQNKGK